MAFLGYLQFDGILFAEFPFILVERFGHVRCSFAVIFILISESFSRTPYSKRGGGFFPFDLQNVA